MDAVCTGKYRADWMDLVWMGHIGMAEERDGGCVDRWGMYTAI